MKFGAGMRFNVNNVSNKPPSRALSKRKTRATVKRADSTNKLMREDRQTYSRGKGGASLARTTGKRASRIIFTEKSDTQPEVKNTKTRPHPATSLPMSSYMKDYNVQSTYKPSISSYLDSQISKPTISSTLGVSSAFTSSSSNSNFPRKIVAKQESSDESTRDDTKLTKSSYFSKTDCTSK